MPSGQLNETHIAAYEGFAQFLTTCYGTSLATASFTSNTTVLTLNCSLPFYAILPEIISLITDRTEIDRIMLQENQTFGQFVREFQVYVDGKVE